MIGLRSICLWSLIADLHGSRSRHREYEPPRTNCRKQFDTPFDFLIAKLRSTTLQNANGLAIGNGHGVNRPAMPWPVISSQIRPVNSETSSSRSSPSCSRTILTSLRTNSASEPVPRLIRTTRRTKRVSPAPNRDSKCMAAISWLLRPAFRTPSNTVQIF